MRRHPEAAESIQEPARQLLQGCLGFSVYRPLHDPFPAVVRPSNPHAPCSNCAVRRLGAGVVAALLACLTLREEWAPWAIVLAAGWCAVSQAEGMAAQASERKKNGESVQIRLLDRANFSRSRA